MTPPIITPPSACGLSESREFANATSVGGGGARYASSPPQHPQDPRHLESITQFIATHWQATQSPRLWHQALTEQGWNRLDWPPEYGGPNWTPTQTRQWINAAANALCPLPDDRFTVIAPLVLALCPAPNKAAVLEALATPSQPVALQLDPAPAASPPNSPLPRSAANQTDSAPAPVARPLRSAPAHAESAPTPITLALANDGADGQLLLHINQQTLPLGKGAAPRHLAEHQSQALNLWQAQLTAQLTLPLLTDADPALQVRQAKAQLMTDTLAALYQTKAHPLAQNLLATQLHTTQIQVLKEALGYYTLIEADPHRTSNEPLPHPAQLAHLRWLEARPPRHPHLQKDLLYAARLASPE